MILVALQEIIRVTSLLARSMEKKQERITLGESLVLLRAAIRRSYFEAFFIESFFCA